MRSVLLLCVALAGCSDQAAQPTPARLDQARASAGNAIDAEKPLPEVIRGNVEIGRGAAEIIVCPGETGGCSDMNPVPGMIGPCWLEFTAEGRARMTDLSVLHRGGPRRAYWIEGGGNVENGRGKYGPSSRYSCLVQMTDVRAFWRQTEERPEKPGNETDARQGNRL